MSLQQDSTLDSSREDSTSESPHIQLTDIKKTFANGTVVACQDINIDIEKDELVVFLGPSGCGKTTTLRLIAGLEEPDSGTISIEGRDVTSLKPKDRELAFVFQSIALYPHMSVRKNMRFGLDMKTDLPEAEKNDRVENAADLLGINDLLDRSPEELSGGQQQRVSLGRAMVMEPAAFLLDEPFSALDANLRDQMRVEVKKLQRNLETSMIFVTHDQEEAMTLGDSIVVMNNGEIQQKGTPYEIYNEPANKFVADFIGSPSTNVLQATANVTDTITIETELFDIELETPPGTVDIDDGQRVTLGVRPEHLSLSQETSSGHFSAVVSVVEPHGQNDAVFLDVDGSEVRSVTEPDLVSGEDKVGVSINKKKVWIFDEKGERLI